MIKKTESLRMCVVCRNMLPKSELIRVVKDASDTVFVDETKKASGRGAWICKKEECLNKLRKSKSLNRAFSKPVSEEIYAQAIGVATNGTKKTN